MNEEDFDKIILDVCNDGMAVPVIATGLPAVDQKTQQMRYIRAMEILFKLQNLNLNQQELQSIQAISNLGDLNELIKNLATYWFEKNRP